jgi:hypothetical protein
MDRPHLTLVTFALLERKEKRDREKQEDKADRRE